MNCPYCVWVFDASENRYIAPIDADDIWYPENLEKQVQCMLSSEQSVGLTYALVSTH
ncbi:hypothetical protein [Tolypothrix sp. VBCCA 56010]|uniref:hypothetical protein n=1 Tax=Tolypothrix sp. VBCCA 56010 TaxID=3137731 RepID=UPI003D7CBB45